MEYKKILEKRIKRASVIAQYGSLDAALEAGAFPNMVDATLSELLVLGLLRQNVRTYFTVFGHGSTEIGEVLRIYSQAGLLNVFGIHNEIEASHAAAALNWVMHEKAAVVTSIGPGAFQALAASLVPASNSIGVWYLFGDETTQDEGFNMQQIPKHEQFLFPRMLETMGSAYSLQEPWSLSTALRRGLNKVNHPYHAGPFYLSMPMNTQPLIMHGYNLRELPCGTVPDLGAAVGDYKQAVEWIQNSQSVLIKVGGGGHNASREIIRLADLSDAVCVLTPIATGIVPYEHPRCMGVGGSKGSICGNFAMENADLLITIGTRAVCQSDCSRTGYPKVRKVININANLGDALHYQDTLALWGDASATLQELNTWLGKSTSRNSLAPSDWFKSCQQKKVEWEAYKQERFDHPTLKDSFWGKEVLTQPAAIKTALDWAADKNVVNIFDAGDVQANSFQIAADKNPGKTFTDTGASYMGFAVSSILATAAKKDSPYFLAFSGDGSFLMNPQVLVDGIEYGAKGCILIFDNNRMGAITGLQIDQYGEQFATWHDRSIDYLQMAKSMPGVLAVSGGSSPAELKKALDEAFAHAGLSVIHIPVYFGTDPLGSLGVFGRWNVGNWVEKTQQLRHQIGL